MVDKDGVELAAIQRLNQKLGEQAKVKDLEIQIHSCPTGLKVEG